MSGGAILAGMSGAHPWRSSEGWRARQAKLAQRDLEDAERILEHLREVGEEKTVAALLEEVTLRGRRPSGFRLRELLRYLVLARRVEARRAGGPAVLYRAPRAPEAGP